MGLGEVDGEIIVALDPSGKLKPAWPCVPSRAATPSRREVA